MQRKKFYIDENQCFISLISTYNLYRYTGDVLQTLSQHNAIVVEHLKSSENFYLVEFQKEIFETTVDEIKELVLRPAGKEFFWPVDVVERGTHTYWVFPYKEVNASESLIKNEMKNGDFFGLEKEHIKTLVINFINAFKTLYDNEYLYHVWKDTSLFVDMSTFNLLLPFTEYVSVGRYKPKTIEKDEYYSEYSDPYALTHERKYDYYSEMFALASLLFRLLIGRFPYEGCLMDGIPKETTSEYAYWLDEYFSHPIFIFDKSDIRNKIGEFGHEKIYLQRWLSLSDNLRNMFSGCLSEANTMRKNFDLITYTPQQWLDEILNFEFKLK